MDGGAWQASPQVAKESDVTQQVNHTKSMNKYEDRILEKDGNAWSETE